MQKEENLVTISNEAAQAVQDILTEKNLEKHALRIYVSGSSCCGGTQFGMALDDKINQNDTAIEAKGVKIIIDPQSLGYMQGATIDFVNDSQKGNGFVINAPQQEQSSCGGGSHVHDENSSCGSGNGCNCG